MNEISKSAPRTKKLGLMPRRTGLPCVLWLLPAVPDAPGVCVETTATQTYEAATTYQVSPFSMRLKGPFRWLELASLGYFKHDNLSIMEDYWHGRETDGPTIIERIKPLPESISAHVQQQDSDIKRWAEVMEKQYQKTGFIDREYQMYRQLTNPKT